MLEAYVRQTIAATPAGAPVQFTWQGGEPTLLGLDFYARAVDLQKNVMARVEPSRTASRPTVR
ncbi:hypothetical protein ACFSTD_05580 [Novosphingobium colocasiae]